MSTDPKDLIGQEPPANIADNTEGYVPNTTDRPNFPTPGANTPQDAPSEATVDQSVPEEVEPAFGVHVVMMPDGAFAIQATGEPNLGEMQMLLSRALKSVECRMVAETVVQLTKQAKDSQRIITPGR